MIANLNDVTNIIKNNPSKAIIQKARQINDKLCMHLYGKNLSAAIKQCKEFVNDDIHKVQTEYAVSNKDMFGRLLQQEDLVFSARGGSTYFGMDKSLEKQMNALLDDVQYDQPLRKWIRNFALQAYRSDPMGVIFMEAEEVDTDDPNPPKIYPTYKSSQKIYDYKTEGRELEYICWQLTNGEALAFGIQDDRLKADAKQKSDYFRFVDDAKDGIYLYRENQVTEFDIMMHGLTETPGFIVSDLLSFDDPTCFLSPLDLVIEVADSFLYDRSIRDLQKKYHGFAKAFEPLLKCGTCNGVGTLSGNACPDCTQPGQTTGSGYKLKTKVSDVAKFPLDMLAASGFDVNKLYGYITTDIKTWEKQDASLDDLEEIIEMTYWGTVRASAKAKMQSTGNGGPMTATENSNNNQPKYARLNMTADWAERTEKMIADFIGAFWFKEQYKKASISYGRNYILETPDEIMAAYQKMRTSGAPDFSLDEQLVKYYNALYANNPFMLAKYIKLLRIEPFPHLSIVQAKALIVKQEDFNCKLYFGEWYSSIPDIVIVNTSDELLRAQLQAYVAKKAIPVIVIAETETVRAM